MQQIGTKQSGRKKGVIIYGSSAYKLLKIIAGGAALGITLAACIAVPNLAIAAKPLIKYLEDRDKRTWQRERKKLLSALERLKNRRLVRLEERRGETYLVITQKGKGAFKKFEIESVAILESEKWDGKWRIVLFDIPEKYKRARNALRDKLRVLNFYPLQKSAFIYPYECRDEIDFIVQFFGVEKHVQYLECDDLGAREGNIRHHFELSLK